MLGKVTVESGLHNFMDLPSKLPFTAAGLGRALTGDFSYFDSRLTITLHSDCLVFKHASISTFTK
jgi:hypothetical protein